jgi:hypothetical protein
MTAVYTAWCACISYHNLHSQFEDELSLVMNKRMPNSSSLSYGPPWAHYLGGYQDRLLGGPLGLPGLRYTAPDDVENKDYGGEVLG